MLENMTNISNELFLETIRNKNVIILYPQTSYRTVFLSYFLDNSDKQLFYFRLSEDNMTIRNFLVALLEQWDEETLPLGDKTRQALSTNDTIKWAQALAQDLANVSPDGILYLDELDRLILSDEYRSFFTTLVENLSQQTRLVINARILTTEPWRQMLHNKQAAVLGTGFRKNNLIYSLDEADKPQLEIYAFGRGHAIANGLAIESWDGALPRNLFFYFIDKDLITRDEIFQIFWPNLSVREATNVFHVTKRKIGERINAHILGGSDYELTNFDGGFYRPDEQIVRHYDVTEFIEVVDDASMTFDDEKQAKLYRRAIELYRAPFLESINMPWVYERRERLQRLFIEALIGLARYHKSIDHPEEALGYFTRVIKEVPQREDSHREVMKLYQQLNRHEDAIGQYQMLRELLQDTLGVEPGRETQELFQQIQS
jgi:two-component SAPR family response regulator